MSSKKLAVFRIEIDYLELLTPVLRARGESLSCFARRAVLTELGKLSDLPVDAKRALGLAGERIV